MPHSFGEAHPRLMALGEHAFADEGQAVSRLLPDAHWFDGRAAAIEAKAMQWVLAVREKQERTGIETFQQQYGLGSHEGIMILCLAEALLRIPDAATADALIHDKLSGGEWDKHIGLGRPWHARAGALGFEIAGAISDAGALRSSAGEFIGGLIHRMGEPLVRGALKTAMKTMSGAFIIGSSFGKARQHAEEIRHEGITYSYDMLGEGARSMAQADVYFGRYLEAINGLGKQSDLPHLRDGISIKLSALHPRFELRNWEALQQELLPKLGTLLEAAARKGIMLTVDAEEATRLDVTLLCFEALLKSRECKGYEGLGLAVQAYQKRASYVLDWLAALAGETGKRICVRLVKGAYWDSEIKQAQQHGLPGYPVFTRKEHTDISYLACARKLLALPQHFYPQFATHNARTIASICAMAENTPFEFQRLWGMGEALYMQVMKEVSAPCRIYAPVGESTHLLSYLIRRILENGANSSFVRGLYDATLDELLADPILRAAAPHDQLPLPDHILPDRRNSRGADFGVLNHLVRLLPAKAVPAVAPKDAVVSDVAIAYGCTQEALPDWRDTPAQERAEILESLAALFSANEAKLLDLLMNEGKKTLADSISEIREAVDYCRYYANETRRQLSPSVLSAVSGEHNSLTLEARGIFVTISPWNFPLAIFTGQIAAALAAGNCVIAKPAEQTPAVAAFAVSLMHAAGIPRHAIQLLCGSGEAIGAALVSHPSCAGVAFTGSMQTARVIARQLAARDGPIVPLIAETGGQNCMIVDSSALIEQAVDDIVASAFCSAGQRCSALRVLFVQDDIANALLGILAGAMAQLRLGDVHEVSVDIGPVIDEAAYNALMRHIVHMKENAKLIAVSPLPKDAEAQLLVAPHAFEIDSIGALAGEVFGPVLHVVRWRAGELEDIIDQINSTGYGLTFGIHSRIDERIRHLAGRVEAGNIYVNRTMIGASVGMQPFGGHGLSGTGPKAGGPHYLARFCRERTVCINSAAVGGNIELLR